MRYISKPPLDDFFVVTVISNTARYHSRYRLYHDFKQMIKCAGVNLITVELAFGHRPHEVTSKDDPFSLQLRGVDEYFHKETLLNLGIAHGKRIIPNAKKVAWIDADCRSARPGRDWFEETWHELQHYEFVQMWEWMQNLDHYYAPIEDPKTHPSFMANYIKYGTPYPNYFSKGPYDPAAKQWGSPGLAWAANLDALDKIGGIPDWAILGAGDWYLAHMLISDLSVPQFEGYSQGYMDKFFHTQALCERWIKRDVGFVRGLVFHDFHGKSKDRQYNTRESILKECAFDPLTDLKRDHQGLWQLETHEPRQIKLRDMARNYIRSRREDSIDL